MNFSLFGDAYLTAERSYVSDREERLVSVIKVSDATRDTAAP